LNFSKESITARPEQTALQDEVSSLEDQRSKLAVDLIQAKGPVSRMELEMVWGIRRSTATKWIDQLVNTGVILRVGHGRNTKYTLAN
jgi:predicted HTH transcriptional regulator